MSGIVLFNLKKNLPYEQYRPLTDRIVNIALNCGNGVLFTPKDYNKELVEKVEAFLAFCVSDDFLYYNPEWLSNCDIVDFNSVEGKELFHKNYKCIVEIAKLLESNMLPFEILIADDGFSYYPEDYKTIDCSADEIENILFEESKANIKNAFQCPPLWLKIKAL